MSPERPYAKAPKQNEAVRNLLDTIVAQETAARGLVPEQNSTEIEPMEVVHLDMDETYEGTADVVMLVWNDAKVAPAQVYGKANFPNRKVAVAVCKDLNIQKTKLGDRGVIYN